MTSLFDIRDLLRGIDTHIKINDISSDFITTFTEKYKNYIRKKARSMNIKHIIVAFNIYIPKSLHHELHAGFTDDLFFTEDRGNAHLFLNLTAANLATYILTKSVECVNNNAKNKEKKIEGVCVILAISKDKGLKELSNDLGVLIPYNNQVKDDISISRQDLISNLGDIYGNVDNMSRDDLLLLNSQWRQGNHENHDEENKRDGDAIDEESDAIQFYRGFIEANNKKGYLISDMLNWSDYDLEIRHDYIQWLFPDKSGGVNAKAPHLTKDDILIFKNDSDIRSLINKASIRMLSFYGYDTAGNQIKAINRRERGHTIGLYSTHNYLRLTRIMKFLNQINMPKMSCIFFLSLCIAMKADRGFYDKVVEYKSLSIWMKTQPYLRQYVDSYDISKMDTSSRDEHSSSASSSSPEHAKRGLSYNNNSCYMDSVLTALLAVPNTVIDDNILTRDISEILKKPKVWKKCPLKSRQDIQQELVNVTKYIRGDNNENDKTCSIMRSLIKKCSGTQDFHSDETQDAGEFLSYLFSLFQVDVAQTMRQSYGSNDGKIWKIIRTTKDNEASPIVDISGHLLQSIDNDYDISHFINQTDIAKFTSKNLWTPDKDNPSVKYSYRKEVLTLVDSPIIIFNVNRNVIDIEDSEEKTIWGKIIAPKNIVLKNRHLDLTSIVIHTGHAHYISVIKIGGIWYKFDDIKNDGKFIIIGTYEKMTQSKPNPMSHGTLYLYY
jgi:hypothetical protein